MKSIVLALILAMTTAAAAQMAPLPQTMKLYNNRNGEVIGTATIWRNVITMRDLNGEIIGTATIEADGKRSFRDPDGKPVSALSIAGPPKSE